MSAPRLSRALAGSAAVHLGLAAGLLALVHPVVSTPPPLRVSLVETPGAPAASQGARAQGMPPATEPAPPAAAAPGRPVRRPSHTTRRSDPREGADAAESASSASAQALVTPVQSDLWMLAAPGPRDHAPASGKPVAAPATGGPSASPGGASAPAAGQGAAGESPGGGTGTGGSSAASLLAALSQRLAWSAERCAPAGTVRLTRRTVPGVPLHFCLDEAGRPSDVDLLGTTGSEALDRAARDCVVPGALPLPPAPGCYTVEVRFPIRG